MVTGKMFRMALDKFFKSPVAQEARVQIAKSPRSFVHKTLWGIPDRRFNIRSCRTFVHGPRKHFRISKKNLESYNILDPRSMDKVSRSADREEHVGGTHPYFFFSRGTWTCGLWLVACGACLWAGPTLFLFSRLRAGGILPALYPFGIF
jgi:hypothetical protein